MRACNTLLYALLYEKHMNISVLLFLVQLTVNYLTLSDIAYYPFINVCEKCCL